MTKWTRDTLLALRADLCREALYAGRYPGDATWETRKSYHGQPADGYCGESLALVPFRCTRYEQVVRQITALDRVLADKE